MTEPVTASKVGCFQTTTQADLDQEGGWAVARRRAVVTLRSTVERRGLELDEASVVMESKIDMDEFTDLALKSGDVRLHYSALAYPPGQVPQ